MKITDSDRSQQEANENNLYFSEKHKKEEDEVPKLIAHVKKTQLSS